MTAAAISSAIIEADKACVQAAAGMDDMRLTSAPAPGKWSAAQQLHHLRKSAAPVALALRLPRFVPRLLFGTANRPSRSYQEIAARYQAKLDGGGKAPGRFEPGPAPERARLLAGLTKTHHQLARLAAKLTESELDTLILPHPLLGKLTMREMLYFTIIHIHHHRERL